MFVSTAPGLGEFVRRELAALPDIRVTGSGNDGRSDLVLCEVPAGREQVLADLRSAEDVFVEAGRTLRSDGDKPHWTAGRLWRPARAEKALELWRSWRPAGSGRGPKRQPGITFRVVARVLQERSYRRTELRRSLTAQVERVLPGWRPADPSALEIWTLEYARGKFVAGLRLSGAAMRQHGGRDVERSGALRPPVAAAMLSLAGTATGTLLDPCCGSGTILAEAQAAGWRAEGRDIDRSAVRAARQNVPGAAVREGDARALDLAGGTVSACVSNLPFGRQYVVEGDTGRWLREVLVELTRVVVPEGRLVLLAPEISRPALPPNLRHAGRYPIRLLGTPTTIWDLRRAG